MKSHLNPHWLSQFRNRMSDFSAKASSDQIPVSIKIGIESGCFHREHSPEAYRIIDAYISKKLPENTRFEEHESGPEILTYVILGLGLFKGIIDLILVIVKARSEGVRKGDRPQEPIEIIVRRIDKEGKYAEENILKIPSGTDIDAQKIADEFIKHSIKVQQPKPRKRKQIKRK